MTSIFVNISNKEKYQCPVCLNLMKDPILTTNCNHNMCSDCWYNVPSIQERQKKKCPICEKYTHQIADNKLQKELDNKNLNCSCGINIKYVNMSLHVKTCPRLICVCKFCKESILYSEFENHLKICSDFYVECKKCMSFMKGKESLKHSEFYCNESETCLKICCEICPDKKKIPVTVFQRHYEQEHLGFSKSKAILPRINPKFILE